jgi:hypothetical protein
MMGQLLRPNIFGHPPTLPPRDTQACGLANLPFDDAGPAATRPGAQDRVAATPAPLRSSCTTGFQELQISGGSGHHGLAAGSAAPSDYALSG